MTLVNDNGTDGQTDRQTNGQTECDAICGPSYMEEGRIITDHSIVIIIYYTMIKGIVLFIS